MRMLEQRGIDCSAALRSLGIDRASVAHPAAKVPTLPAIEVFQQLVAEHGGPSLGLELGLRINWGELGDVGRAMLSCATLGEALRCAQEFYALVSPSFCMQVELRPEAVVLTWRPAQAMPYDFVLFCFDMSLGTINSMVERLLGEDAPLCDAYLTRARPAHFAAYRPLRHIRCHFGQPGEPSLRVCLPASLWDHPMALRNTDELAMLRLRMQQQAQPINPDGMTQWVEMMLREAMGEQPSQAFLAKVAGISSSTLARRLTAEGTTFRGIANRVRYERACQMLRGGRLGVAEIGAQLGYADTPSFVRAFRVMGGVTPGQFAASPPNPPTICASRRLGGHFKSLP